MRRIKAAILLFCLFLLPLSAREETFALVLSGGGARGIAHIPVIEELERRGIVPDLVVGTSMGGLVGGLYCAGYSSQDIYDLIESMDLMSAVFKFTSQLERVPQRAYELIGEDNFVVNFSDSGLGDSDALLDDWRINRIIHEAICRVEYVELFDDLSIPFRTVGTDYATGDGIIFDSGSLYEALRGTMSMPVFFPAMVLDDGTYVVDGGVYNNLPVDLARSLGADIILAVDVNESVRNEGVENGAFDSITGSLNHYLTLVGQIQSEKQYEGADYVLIPDTGAVWVADFSDPASIVEIGRDCVASSQAVFDEIEARLSGKQMDSVRPYRTYEAPVIEGFSFDESLSRFSGQFDSLIGRPYDEEAVEEIDRMLSMIRRMTGKLTISYKLVDGTVAVTSRDYASSKSVLRVGIEGGLHSFTDIQDGQFKLQLDPDFHIAYDFWLDQNRLSAALKMGQYNTLSLSGFFPFSRTLALDVDLHGSFGGMSAISDRVYEYRYPTRDWSFGARGSLVLLYGISHRLDFSLGYDFTLLGQMPVVGDGFEVYDRPIWENRTHHLPYLEVSYNFDASHLESMQESGFSMQTALRLGWDEGFAYLFRFDFDSSIRLSAAGASFLDASLELFTSRFPVELLESYRVDSFGQLTDDLVLLEIRYRHYFFPRDNGFHLTGGLFVEGLSRQGLGAMEGSLIPFADINGIEGGIVLSIGYISDFGDAALTFHASVTGRMSLTLDIGA